MDRTSRTLPMIAVPGTLCTGEAFTPLDDCLGGIIPVPLIGRTVGEAARAILAKAPERFDLCGFSLGGFVALEIAVIAPEKVARLVLLGSSGRPDRTENRETRLAQLEEGTRIGNGNMIRQRLWEFYVAPANRDDSALRSAILSMADSTPAGVFADQTELAIGRPGILDRMRRLQAPFLAVHGREDVACPPVLGQELCDAARPGQGTLAVVEGAGHFAMMERPRQVADAIGGWLARSSQQPVSGVAGRSSW